MSGIVGLILAGLLTGGGPDGKAALERLKTLAGKWRGHVVTADGPEAEVYPVELRFDFAGGANIDPARSRHMHAGAADAARPGSPRGRVGGFRQGKADGREQVLPDRVKAAAERP